MDAINMALDIIKATHDGDNLDPRDLKLVEMAVNGFLNSAGDEAFTDLHRRVLAGEYARPWFHGIEHLTIDYVGYVYWKGILVEHYDIPFAYTGRANEEARELAQRCILLERTGYKVHGSNAIWRWDDLSRLEREEQGNE